jgi:two-component system sensor histidine kinase KdpD
LRKPLSAHTVQVQIPADFPLLFVDGVLLEQTFVNLLENASRYTPAGSQIEIVARVVEGRAEIQFCDHGPGLPEGAQEKVFDKFFRATTATADGRRGVGLGLAICRGIIAAHGGRITAANRPAGGAVFTVLLPCKQQPEKIPLPERHTAAALN